VENQIQNLNSQANDREMAKDPMKITIIVPTNAYFISGIRDFTLALIKNTTHFSEQWAFRFQSVVDELCNNAIEHGSARNCEIKIAFIVKSDEFVRIEVQDTGTGPKKLKAADLKKLVDERKDPEYIIKGIRGRGLSKIVVGWTDSLEFFDTPEGGIKVVAQKKLDKSEDQSLSQPNFVSGIVIHN
jgi:anti-sigma regulatory factor (Ser/Thr protein kinase)